MFALLLGATMHSVLEGGLVDELEPLYPDSVVGDVAAPRLETDVALGTYAGTHLFVSGLTPGARATIQVKLRGEELPGVGVSILRDVPVEVNTGIDGRTEWMSKKENPYVIRRAPFRIYDALEPTEPTFVARGVTMAFRLEFEATTAGDFPLEVSVKQGDDELRCQWHVVAYPVRVPGVANQQYGFTNWFSLGNIASYHKVELWSEEFWRVLARYARLMARSRQNTFLVPWELFTRETPEGPRLDEERLDRWVATFYNEGLRIMEGGHIAGREGGDWSAKRFMLYGTEGLSVGSPEGEAFLRSRIRMIRDAVQKRGWQKRWLQHIADEPIDVNVASYAAIAKVIREEWPDVRIFEATMSRSLVGAVQGWCPQVQEFQHAQEFFDARMGAGDQVWTYTCLSPGGPFLNRLLDQERLRPLFVGWSMVRYDLDGFLHWGFNYWKGDPFSQSVVPHEDANNQAMSLPAGDTHVAYPGPKGPWSSTRLEAHRIGFEDAELLLRYRARDREGCAALMAKVFRAYDDYTKNVKEYRAAKRELLIGASGGFSAGK